MKNSIIINYFLNHYNNGRKALFVIKNNSLIAIIFKIDKVRVEKGYIMIATNNASIFVDEDAKVEIH